MEGELYRAHVNGRGLASVTLTTQGRTLVLVNLRGARQTTTSCVPPRTSHLRLHWPLQLH